MGFLRKRTRKPHNTNPNNYWGKYVSAQGAKNLHNYQYRGSDASYYYNYLTNPYLYPWVLDHIPLWVAPNLITLAGLICTVVTNVIMMYYCPKLEGHAPTWAYWANGICFFLYQTLDAVDGKQARRTGSSGPLGLLFDHGCDAINTTVSSLTLLATIQMGPTSWSFCFWGLGVLGFYAATWEEYYTGELSLPVINGPNEGIVITCLIHIFTGIVGPDFWLTESSWFNGYLYNQIFFFFILAAGVCTIVSNILNVIKAVKLDAEDKNFSLPVALTRMTPFIVFVSLALGWVIHSPNNIMQKHPQLVIWSIALLWSKLVTQLMVAHLCDEEYHPFGKTLSVFFVLALHAAYDVYKQELVDEEFVLKEFFAIGLFAYAHLVVSLIWEVTGILRIKCFSIPCKVEKEAPKSPAKAKKVAAKAGRSKSPARRTPKKSA
ncbi:hypothetical protein TeGR_g12277 [Tetraparma gracilis]|uniref:Uncharacterized protein n=1 Tax=Tetraparma gracilis TaxID=2962635 RepID=A0ABQ6MWI4_9STRA|nr:hypothetical protein TeGR_g12277 [Tetraparma gracilis]